MKIMRVDEARESFSALVSAAERGEPTTILRDGRPAAVIVPVAEGRRLYPSRGPEFVDFLFDFPGGIEFERDRSALSDLAL